MYEPAVHVNPDTVGAMLPKLGMWPNIVDIVLLFSLSCASRRDF